jgi:hypothetical protein
MEWQEELKTEGWYGCIAPDGWKDIVLDTDKMLAYIDPDYEITQIKEKFGTLRYYYSSKFEYGSIEGNIMEAITRAAEARSASVCEICGKWGSLDDSSYYIRTLCNEHKRERQ